MAVSVPTRPRDALAPAEYAAAQPRSSTGATIFFLAVITLAGTVLRLWNSDAQSLRLDEGFSISWASYPLHSSAWSRSLFQISGSDVHPPGYFLLLQFWMQAFGTQLAILRLPSELASIATIPALFLLASALYGRSVGLFASLLGAVSPFWIWHAQETRMYPFLLLFTVLSTYGLVLALEHRRAIGWPIFVVSSIIAIYMQYYAFLVLFAQGLFVLIYLQHYGIRRVAVWAGCLVVMALTYLPWVITFHANYHGASDPSLQSPTLYTPLVILSDVLFGYLTTPDTSKVIAAWPLLVPLGLALGVYVTAMSRRTALLWLLFLVPLVVSFTVTLTIRPFIAVRYLVVVVPALYVLIAVAIVRFQQRRMRFGIMLVAVLASVISLWIEETSVANPQVEDFRVVAQYLERHARPGDIIGLDVYFNQDAFSYYSHLNLPVYDLPMPPGEGAITPAVFKPYFSHLRAGHNRLWVLYYLENNGAPGGFVRHYLDYHTAAHTVIFGGPYNRNDPRFPASYRNVQLVLYQLTRLPATPVQVRPPTNQELRALTHLSPTVREPFAPAFSLPGSTAQMIGPLVPIPYPYHTWWLPAIPHQRERVRLILFNPNPYPATARVEAAGPALPVPIPPQSNVEISLKRWNGQPFNPIHVTANYSISVMRTVITAHTQKMDYAFHGSEKSPPST